MRILQILSGTELNGAVTYAFKLCELLTARGHEVLLLRRPYLDQNVPVAPAARLVDSTLKRHVGEIRRIGAFCAQEKIDVIHTHMSSASAFGAVLRLFYRIPCVATAHKLNLQLHWAINDRVLCHNDESMRYMRRVNLVLPSRLKLVRPFLDERETDLPREPRETTLQRLGLPLDRPILITVGHFIPRKGLLDIADAMSRVAASGSDALMVFCGWSGEANYRAAVEARIAEHGLQSRVRWFTQLSDHDRVHLTRCADLFIQASHVETGPLSALEAMAHGLPVVGTRCGTMEDFIVPNVTGQLVPVAQPQQLADAIIGMLKDRDALKRKGNAGRQRFLDLFSATANMGLIEQAYRDAMARLQ